MIMKNRKSNIGKSGFTLVELIVALAIAGIVVTGLFTIFNHNLKTFNWGKANADEQAALRLAAYTLTDEFRNIGYIDLANHDLADTAEMGAIDATDYFVFMSSSGIKKGSAATSIFNLTGTEVTGLSYSLIKRVDKYYLGITLTGNKRTFTTEVLLNNIVTNTAVQMDSTDIGLSGFTSIQYNYNQPPLTTSGGSSGTVSKPVTAIIVTGEGGATSITTASGNLQMSAVVEPSDADITSLNWTVDDTGIAAISSSGLLTAQSNGTVEVTATARDGSGVTGTKQITIIGQTVTALSLNTPGTSVVKGQIYKYTASASGGIGNCTITISNVGSNGNTPSVSGNTITWMANTNGNKTMHFTVTITDSASPQHTYTTGVVTVTATD